MTLKSPILLEPMEFPDPVIEIASRAENKGDQEKMGEALARLAKEDPSFRVSSDEKLVKLLLKEWGSYILISSWIG